MGTEPRFVWLLCATFALPACDLVQSALGNDEGEQKQAKAEDKPAKATAKADKPAPAKPVKGGGADESAEKPAPEAAAAKAPDEPTPEAKAEPEGAPTDAAAAPSGAAPCIVGKWKAVDYLAAINRAVYRDPQLRKLKYKSKSGTIFYDVVQSDAGEGEVTATADGLRYAFAGKVQGFAVSASVTLDGTVKANYKLEDPSRIVIAKPTENKLKVRASAKVKGLGGKRMGDKVKYEFNGDFPYECEGDHLKVWDRGTKTGQPLDFKRMTD